MPSPPFDTPAQFVFLVALVTSVVTLQVIKNQISAQKYYFKDKGNKLNENRAKTAISLLDKITAWQLFLIILVCLRIIFSGFSMTLLIYDRTLVIVGGIIFGMFWPMFFFATTKYKESFLDKISENTIKPTGSYFLKNPIPLLMLSFNFLLNNFIVTVLLVVLLQIIF